ncbi:MAG TPA: HAD-IA family hydrolase [Allosphingosinicella sp.]|jgi:phosphoglycolate phosphatase
MNRLALFDCDGTIVDGQAPHRLALAETFAAEGLAAPSDEAARRLIGLGLVETMAALLPDAGPADHIRLAEAYKRAFHGLRARGRVEEPLFPGVAELLDALEEDGWLLGIATGKSARGLDLCLACHGLSRRFVTRQTADLHPSKPHPSMIEAAMAEAGASPETTVMIGDTSYDMMMAREAGTAAIGVAWGYHPASELIAAGAHHIAVQPLDILDLAKVSA